MPLKTQNFKKLPLLGKKPLYTNVNWPKNHQKTIMWHGRFVSCNILFSCLFFFGWNDLLCLGREDLTALAWPLEVPPQRWPEAWWTRGFVEDVPSASAWWWGVPRGVAGEGKSPVSHHVSHHWCNVLFIGGKERIYMALKYIGMHGDDLMMMILIIVITIILLSLLSLLSITITLYQYHYYYYYHYHFAEPSKRTEFHTSTVSPMALSSITARISSDDLTSCIHRTFAALKR